MRLNIGDTAPDVTLFNQNSAEISLDTTWQDGPTVLSFLRHFG